jgi:hypothetical protein
MIMFSVGKISKYWLILFKIEVKLLQPNPYLPYNVNQSFPDNGTNSIQTMWKNELHDNDKIKFDWYFKTIHLFYVKFSHVNTCVFSANFRNVVD